MRRSSFVINKFGRSHRVSVTRDGKRHFMTYPGAVIVKLGNQCLPVMGYVTNCAVTRRRQSVKRRENVRPLTL